MKIFILLSCLALPLSLQAQFTGDAGSGATTASLSSPFLCSFYFGGEYSGYDTLYLDNTTYYCGSLYVGDSASGYSQIIKPSTQNCGFFTGEDGSGYSQDMQPSTLNCVFFLGSQGQGYHQRSAIQDNGGFCGLIVLGVEAGPLQAQWQANQAQIFWTTYAEPQNEGFELWKSEDGLNWVFLDWLPARGTAQSGADYRYTDAQKPQPIQYYRYKQLNYEGLATWSNIVALSQDQSPSPERQWILFPNPVPSQQSVQLRGWNLGEGQANLRWRLVNPLGQILRQGQEALSGGEALLSISTSELPAGLYYLSVQLSDTESPIFLPLRVY